MKKRVKLPQQLWKPQCDRYVAGQTLKITGVLHFISRKHKWFFAKAKIVGYNEIFMFWVFTTAFEFYKRYVDLPKQDHSIFRLAINPAEFFSERSIRSSHFLNYWVQNGKSLRNFYNSINFGATKIVRIRIKTRDKMPQISIL